MNEHMIDTIPAHREYATVWACYALFVLALFMGWPALVAAAIGYAKRDAPNLGIINAHYRWLIQTFGWGLALFVVCVGVVILGASPMAHSIFEAMRASGADWAHVKSQLALDWRTVFLAVGMGMFGAFGLLVLWCWVAYRIVRGAIRLLDARAVP